MRHLVLLLLLAFPAAAQDRPHTVPQRDVDVTYRAGTGAQAMEQRSRWRVADGKVRLDPPTPGVYMILDTRAGTMAMVSDADRGVVDLPLPPMPGTVRAAPGAAMARVGSDRVAGLPCTEWEATDTQGLPTVACYTDDGVMLRARRGATVFVEAKTVAYVTPDDAAFAVPPSYAHARPRDAR